MYFNDTVPEEAGHQFSSMVVGPNTRGELSVPEIFISPKKKKNLAFRSMVMNENMFSFGLGQGLKSFGSNNHGALGIGYDLTYYGFEKEKNSQSQETDVIFDDSLKGFTVEKIFTGSYQTFLLMRDQNQRQAIGSFGRCINGNLGRGFSSIKVSILIFFFSL